MPASATCLQSAGFLNEQPDGFTQLVAATDLTHSVMVLSKNLTHRASMFGLFIDNNVLRQVGNQLKNPPWIIDYVLILQVFISLRFSPFIFFSTTPEKDIKHGTHYAGEPIPIDIWG